MLKTEDLYQTPNALAPHYSRFAVGKRLLLTGHSHQAWPDCGFEGQKRAWLDAAEFVDTKWDRAFAKADRVRAGYAKMLDDTTGSIALAGSTHDLVIRFLSGLPLRERPRLVTTDGEYHSIRRQLDRLAEEGVDVVKVAAHPAATAAERLADAANETTAAVLASSVYFQTGHIVPNLGELQNSCRRVGAALLVDAYHAVNVVPLPLKAEGLDDAYIVGGGYKYCQLGEGNCFLRFPRDCTMRPVITGWFAEFTQLAEAGGGGRVAYGGGPERFAGSTYDPTCHYRASEVLDFFELHDLAPGFLREVSQHQIGVLVDAFDNLDADPRVIDRDRSVGVAELGGFLALRSPQAGRLHGLLSERGVSTDYRGDLLRLGPAPYLSDQQLADSVGILGDVVRGG